MADELIDYYGTECVHCNEMLPLIEKLEKELGVKIVRKEVWHDAKNQEEFMKEAKGKCNGVPFLLNKKNGKFICGAATYDKLKDWAK